MSAIHETPVATTEAAPSSGLDTTAPISTDVNAMEPSTKEPHSLTDPADPPAVAAPVDPPAAAIESSKEEAVKIEAVPITSGNLGFKTGPLKLFKFSQRYFWLGDEAPLEDSTITHFHKGNHENKHHTAAHASQTGKGLLLYAKRAEDKTQPEGIFNLAEVTDVTKDGPLEFSFKINDKKQSFQATKVAERDGWLVAINNAVNEAVASKDSFRETDGYKDSYKKYFGTGSALTAGAGVGGAGIAAAKEHKTENKVEEGTAVPVTEGTTTKKDGSRSRSRGPLNLFKQNKDKNAVAIENAKEKAEIKKEEKKEEKAEAKREEEVATVGTGAAVGTTAAATELEGKTPTQKKRQSSLFGIFKKNDDKSAALAKEPEPVAAEAPKIETAAETSAPLMQTMPTETTTEPTGPSTAFVADATPPVAETTSTAPTATTGKTARSPSPKSKGFGGLFGRSDKKVTKSEEVAPTAATTAESSTPTETVKTDAAPVADSVSPAAETTTAETSAEETAIPAAETKATGPTKVQDKRRSSLQAFLGFGKNKDTTATKEPEVATNAKDDFASLPKKDKLGMFRSSSKKVKETTPTTTDTPAIPTKDIEPIAESAPGAGTEAVPNTVSAGEDATVVERPAGTAVPTVGLPVAT